MYKIEKKIAIPPLHASKPLEYPIDQMKVGDSILIPNSSDCELKARSFPYSTARKMGMRMTRRRVPEGYRFWRIE